MHLPKTTAYLGILFKPDTLQIHSPCKNNLLSTIHRCTYPIYHAAIGLEKDQIF